MRREITRNAKLAPLRATLAPLCVTLAALCATLAALRATFAASCAIENVTNFMYAKKKKR